MGPRTWKTSIPRASLNFCIRGPCYASIFLLVLKTGNKSSSCKNDWHIGIPCSLPPTGQGFFRSFFALFLTHLLSGSTGKWQVPACLCVCVHTRDYKSHSANGVSALPATSFHTWQMTTLSAHNTVFLLPRLQHIVLFGKQTFQPILFVVAHGGGPARAHFGKPTRHT